MRNDPIRHRTRPVLLRLYERVITDGESTWRIERLRRRLEELGTPSSMIDAAHECGYAAFDAIRNCTAPRAFA